MPAKRELSMRQLRHLLRLHHDGVSAREIGRRLGVARSTIQDNLKRAAAAGLAWPLADDITDEALETRLFGRAGVTQGQRRRVEPDWPAMARELKRPGVTMSILWEEYREVHPEGYGYSRFCDLLRGFERRLTPVMRQHHVAGEKAFVDYSGEADRDRRSDDGRDPRGGDLRRPCSARRASPSPRRPGRRRCRTGSAPTCARSSAIGGVPEACRAGQREDRHHQGLLLRARGQPHLRRDGGALRHAPSCRRGRESRATRRVLHTAPCSDPDGTTGANRGCGPRPPWPLRMTWSSGTLQRPRFRLSI